MSPWTVAADLASISLNLVGTVMLASELVVRLTWSGLAATLANAVLGRRAGYVGAALGAGKVQPVQLIRGLAFVILGNLVALVRVLLTLV